TSQLRTHSRLAFIAAASLPFHYRLHALFWLNELNLASAACPGITDALEDDGICRDRHEDKQPKRGIFPEFADAQPYQALLYRADQHSAERGAEHRAGPAKDVDPTHHSRRDDLQF